MRPAVLSRCAPAFTIRPCSPEQIAQRLGQICTAEGIDADHAALVLIAEAVECHIRDAIKAVEGVAHLGEITVENAREYLHLDAHTVYLEILDALGADLGKLVAAAQRAVGRVSPATAYTNMASLAVTAFHLASLEIGNVPSYLDKEKLKQVGARHGAFLIEVGSRLSSRPSRVSATMLLCDLVSLHHLATGQVTQVVRTATPIAVAPGQMPSPVTSEPSPGETAPSPEQSEPSSLPVEAAQKPLPSSKSVEESGNVESHVTSDGVYLDPRAQRTRRNGSPASRAPATFTPDLFAERLEERLRELAEEDGGPKGRHYLGSS